MICTEWLTLEKSGSLATKLRRKRLWDRLCGRKDGHLELCLST